MRESMASCGATLLCVDVGERSAWKAEDHPLRHDGRFKLTCIPTLVYWTHSGAARTLSTWWEGVVADLVTCANMKCGEGEEGGKEIPPRNWEE